jgi:ubiquinone/menaquinone biosynthesis C-methylase UbiE
MLAACTKSTDVLEMALQTLEDFNLSNQPGIEDALIDAYRSLSPRGRLLVMQSSDNPEDQDEYRCSERCGVVVPQKTFNCQE